MCLRITKETHEETSAVIAVRVARARDRQMNLRGKLNVDLNTQEIQKFCELGEGEKKFLLPAMDTLKLSARAYHRVLRVARTLADLGEVDEIQKWHLQEAFWGIGR